jgi:hypothetical protein
VPAAAATPEVTAWFAAQGLPLAFAAALGCETVADIALLTEEDLKEVGMKAAQRRRLLSAAAGGSAPPSATPTPRVSTAADAADANDDA